MTPVQIGFKPDVSFLVSSLLVCTAGGGCAASTLDEGADAAQTRNAERTESLADAAPAHTADAGARACPGLTLTTRAELAAAHDCAVIDGDLLVVPRDFDALTAADLPQLHTITGSLRAFPQGRLERLELPALTEIGTPGQNDMLNIAVDADTLQEVSLPALRAVHGDVVIGIAGGLEALQLAQLSRVDGKLELLALPALEQLSLDDDVQVGDQTRLLDLCRLPAERLESMRVASSARASVEGVGCCTDDARNCPVAACRCE